MSKEKNEIYLFDYKGIYDTNKYSDVKVYVIGNKKIGICGYPIEKGIPTEEDWYKEIERINDIHGLGFSPDYMQALKDLAEKIIAQSNDPGDCGFFWDKTIEGSCFSEVTSERINWLVEREELCFVDMFIHTKNGIERLQFGNANEIVRECELEKDNKEYLNSDVLFIRWYEEYASPKELRENGVYKLKDAPEFIINSDWWSDIYGYFWRKKKNRK